MRIHLTVAWTVTAGGAPRPWLHCRRCGAARPFGFAGKARLNSNGKRFDGWLVYRCAACEATWNRPVFERCRAQDVPPGLIEALRLNLAAPLLRIARDRDGLARYARRVEDEGALGVTARVLCCVAADGPGLTLRIRPEEPVGPRLDRLLAQGLRLSRSKISRLADAGRLTVAPGGCGALARPLREAVKVGLALEGEADAEEILRAASLP